MPGEVALDLRLGENVPTKPFQPESSTGERTGATTSKAGELRSGREVSTATGGARRITFRVTAEKTKHHEDLLFGSEGKELRSRYLSQRHGSPAK